MNNPLLYGAAIAGFMAQARCPIGMPSSVYASLETAAQAFASAVDADIPTDLAISDSKVNAMSLIVAAAMTGAYETDPNQADYTALAQGVVALYNAAVTAGVPSSSAPNVVSITNAGGLNAANPLVFSAPAITRKGSGYFEVSASACPVLGGGGGIVMTFTLWRDYGQPNQYQLQTAGQVIARKILPAGAGQDAEGAIGPFVDIVADTTPHIYSLVMSNTAAQNMTDNAGHAVITVKELN